LFILKRRHVTEIFVSRDTLDTNILRTLFYIGLHEICIVVGQTPVIAVSVGGVAIYYIPNPYNTLLLLLLLSILSNAREKNRYYLFAGIDGVARHFAFTRKSTMI